MGNGFGLAESRAFSPIPEPGGYYAAGDKINLEIPELASYEDNASEEFWGKFPKRDLPTTVNTRVNTTAFKRKIFAARDKMSKTEYNRAKRTLRNLQKGANSYQKAPLPPVSAKKFRKHENLWQIFDGHHSHMGKKGICGWAI